MKKHQAIELLKIQRDERSKLPKVGTDAPDFMKWRRDTEVVIRKIFGDASRHVEEFRNIGFNVMFFPSSPQEKLSAYGRGMARADTLLLSLIDEIEKFGLTDDELYATSTPHRFFG